MRRPYNVKRPFQRESMLLHQYRISVDEYRFEVNLNNTRTRDSLVLNVGLFAAGLGLLELDGSSNGGLVAAFVFLIGSISSFWATMSIHRGHRYYRRTVFKKTLLEQQLGFLTQIPAYDDPRANMAVQSTVGMENVEEILKDPKKYINAPFRWGSVYQSAVGFLLTLMIVNLVALISITAPWFVTAWRAVSTFLGNL